MQKKIVMFAVGLVMALSLVALGGCNAETEQVERSAELSGVPAIVPASHGDRYEVLGSDGCYGCHGAGDLADPMLNGATPLPLSHYKDGTPDTREIDPVHNLCNTCHVQEA